MSFRTDVTIDFSVSPRIITVLSPSTEINIQDLYDTCRNHESRLYNSPYDKLISAGGKEELGGGVKVGVTATLLNAVLAFEARPGPSFVQCNVSGGNLVALDSNGDPVSSILPTAFTQVILTSSSSATLQELADIQFSSFNGHISVKPTSIYSGTGFPVGTERQPANNMADALTIAQSRGINTFLVKSDLVLSNIDVSSYSFLGEQHNIMLTVDSSANVEECNFYNLTLQGVLSGASHIRDCFVMDISNVHGHLTDCSLDGYITLSGTGDLLIINCWDHMAGFGLPSIDCDGYGSNLTIREYRGGLFIKNKTGTDEISIDMNSARIVLDSTVTDGDIIVRGVGHLTNNGTANVDSTNVVNPGTVSVAVLNKMLPFLP